MRMKKCEKCGTANYLDAAVCSDCETAFSPMWECQWCVTWNSFTHTECGGCGTSINTEHPEECTHPPGPVIVGRHSKPELEENNRQNNLGNTTSKGLFQSSEEIIPTHLFAELKTATQDLTQALTQQQLREHRDNEERLEAERQAEAYQRYLENNHPEAERGRYIGESQAEYWQNTLKSCPLCEEVINIKAKYCKHCREDLPKPQKQSKVLPLALGAFIGYKLFSSNKDKK